MHTPQPLRAALGAMANIPQFFVWRLDWDAVKNKYVKVPWFNGGPVDAQLPASWHTYDAADALRMQWSATAPVGVAYALGWMFTPGCGYWFLDLDGCIGSDGQYAPLAIDWLAKLPGCFFEFSSSGKGVHVLGRGNLPEHSKRNKLLGAELYTEARGIAFGLSGEAYGCADIHAPGILEIAAQHFPPRAVGADGEWLKPRADWAGPTDDAELLRRMLSSASVAAKLGHRATFAQLWANAPELEGFYGPDTDSERDAALAAHLAFWTGCDAPRMERLMRQSALARPKWDEHRTYLRELTIEGACARQGDVLQDRPRVDVAAQMYGPPVALPALPGTAPLPTLVAPVVPPAVTELVERMLQAVNSAGHWAELHNSVIPMVRDSGIPPALMPMLETAITARLAIWGAKMPMGKLRALLCPPRAPSAGDTPTEGGMLKPDWAAHFVYLQQLTCFFDLRDATTISPEAFRAQYNRLMPFKNDGPARQDACMYMTEHWGCPVVFDTMYQPADGTIVRYEGREWANLYSPGSVPVPEDYTEAGVTAITRFQQHLYLLCGQRDRVYQNLLAWMAHNVQFPGKKIRWVPIIKGINGDGKSTVGEVMTAAMGSRNAISVGSDIVNHPGGFTDWAHGHALVALEEIYLTGRERFKIANTIKPFISNNRATIHPKGGKIKKVLNTCNQLAYTNHNDGVPIEDSDRRWFVIFSPYGSLSQLMRDLGVTETRQYFDVLYDSLKREPGQWRKWLLEHQIPAWFDADGSAMATDEKSVMAESGTDDLENVMQAVIDEGAPGVSAQCISSSCLRAAVVYRAMAEGLDMPKTFSMHHMLNRLNFVRVSKGHTIFWDGKNHRVWLKAGIAVNNEVIRQLLEATKK